MNSLILTCAILVFSQSSLAKKELPPMILAPSENNCRSEGLQCSDCETIQYCSNQQPLFQLRCAEQSKGRPFCDSSTNSCVKDKPVVCNVEEPEFVCPNVGTYPDLDNCRSYYICDENLEAISQACPLGQIYDHASRGCTPKVTCKSYSSKTGLCRTRINKLVAYAPSRDLYILCLSGRPSMLFQCPIEGDVFNEEEATCRFECTSEGYFVNHADRSKFYACRLQGKKFIINVFQCPPGMEFVPLNIEGLGICTTVQPEVEGSGEAPEEVQRSIVGLEPALLQADSEELSNEDTVESEEN